LLAG